MEKTDGRLQISAISPIRKLLKALRRFSTRFRWGFRSLTTDSEGSEKRRFGKANVRESECSGKQRFGKAKVRESEGARREGSEAREGGNCECVVAVEALSLSPLEKRNWQQSVARAAKRIVAASLVGVLREPIRSARESE